jgi:ATP-binding cassette subfamily B protein
LLKQVSFQYGNPEAPFVLKNLDLLIPAGKVTAIVGMSGSGKTTLIKLLLKFYQVSKGAISIGNRSIDQVHARAWRAACGVVMQDGYIFMDTIANNIYAGTFVKNEKRLHEVARMANMHDFFSSMPFGYQTVVGKDGYGLSEGQKQRLLIARLIYRNPAYVFLDEATNALDAHNELSIVNNLNGFFKGKTVLIVAHRLSTVKNADQIVVLNQGELVEKGTHQELIQRKGSYYHLIKNQLELSK